MQSPIRTGALFVCMALGWLSASGAAQGKRSCEDIETFMRNATLTISRGDSGLMDDGTVQHRVFVHTKNESYRDQQNRDTWKANVAAYELAKILQINIIPPYVEIRHAGTSASVAWGLDDVMMDVGQLKQRNVPPPDSEGWNRQMYLIQVFDELVYIGGRAPTDTLITRNWQAWIIGPSQAFRPTASLQNPQNLVHCDRKLLARMRTLDKDVLTIKLGNWLTKEEIEALRARAAKIVEFFDREIAAKGEAAVLFDLDRSGVCAF